MNTSRRIRQAGFTLVELMISLVISLLIAIALITLLTNVSRNNSELSKVNRVIENGRFVLQLLTSDLTHAGFWGGHIPQFDDLSLSGGVAPTDVPTSVPDPCLAYASWSSGSYVPNLVGMAVQSYEIPTVVPSPAVPVCAGKVLDSKGGTDVLFVRHLEQAVNCSPAVAGCPLPTVDDLYFQVSRCGDVAPVPSYVWGQYAAANFNAVFSGKSRAADCLTATPSELRKFVSNLYYVRNYSSVAGDGIPTLMRSAFRKGSGGLEFQAAEAVIEGVEGFRVEFGVDNISDAGTNIVTGADSSGVVSPDNLQTAPIKWAPISATVPENSSPTNRGDGSPDGLYIRCTTAAPCTSAQLMNVVAVKIYVLVRSDSATPGYSDVKTYNLGSTTVGPFNDGFKRRLFFQTIRLVNVSTRRETP